jgi:hypothetical protein
MCQYIILYHHNGIRHSTGGGTYRLGNTQHCGVESYPITKGDDYLLPILTWIKVSDPSLPLERPQYRRLRHHPTSLQPYRCNLEREQLISSAVCKGPTINKQQTPWPESASKLHRPCDRRLSAKLVPTFVDRGCHVVTETDS